MEKMKGVAPKKNTPELVAGNKDVVAEARKMKQGGGSLSQQVKQSPEQAKAAMHKFSSYLSKPRKSGGICASDWTAAQGEGQKPRG